MALSFMRQIGNGEKREIERLLGRKRERKWERKIAREIYREGDRERPLTSQSCW